MGSLDQTIGANVRRLRQERHLTQQELAQAARCAQSTISGIERGTTKAGRSLIERVAKVFDVPEWRIFLDRITAAELREFPETLRKVAGLAGSPDSARQELGKRLIELIEMHLELARPRKRRQLKQQR
jgi:transcriptional regulator with XRE-family HTH domain